MESIGFGFYTLAKVHRPVICERPERAKAKCGHSGVVKCTEARNYPSTQNKNIHTRHKYKAYSNLMITKEAMCDHQRGKTSEEWKLEIFEEHIESQLTGVKIYSNLIQASTFDSQRCFNS